MFLNPISSTNAECFLCLTAGVGRLLVGGFGVGFCMAYVTAPMIVVEMPSAVIGVEDRIVCESAASSMPVAVMDVASVGYLYAVGMLA